MPALFSDDLFSLNKGVWRSEISWLFLIHFILSENKKMFFKVFIILSFHSDLSFLAFLFYCHKFMTLTWEHPCPGLWFMSPCLRNSAEILRNSLRHCRSRLWQTDMLRLRRLVGPGPDSAMSDFGFTTSQSTWILSQITEWLCVLCCCDWDYQIKV